MKTALRLRVLGVAALAVSGLAGPAEAGYVVTLTQQGSDVVATGNGPIDLTGLTSIGFTGFFSGVAGTGVQGGGISTGQPGAPQILDIFTGFTGPATFGSGGFTLANSGSGDDVGIITGFGLGVPANYVSGGALSDISTYDNQTFNSLGVTPGIYEWKWGGGANQNFTLEIGTVPEPAIWAMMVLSFGFLGLLVYRKTRSDYTLA
jgi:hypothetical protein